VETPPVPVELVNPTCFVVNHAVHAVLNRYLLITSACHLSITILHVGCGVNRTELYSNITARKVYNKTYILLMHVRQNVVYLYISIPQAHADS
jgi:hypothetical protein